MPSVPELIGDWSFIDKIGARPSSKHFEPIAILPKTTATLRQGGTIALTDVPEEWKQLSPFLDEQSLPFVFYISDQKWLYRLGPGYKFHFKWCSTLEGKQRDGTIKRYRAKYDICNPAFEINDGKEKTNCKVCLNCCNEFQSASETVSVYQYFHAYGGDIVDKFLMPAFFEKFGKIDLPESTHPGGRDGYTRDWPVVARKEKEKAGWKCLDCRKDFSHNKQHLHVHHKNGVKSHNVSDNLEVVCHSCHAKKPGHGHMRS